MRMPGPGDRIGHAEIRFGDSVVMLADEVPEMVIMSPEKYGGSPVSLMIYVQDVDAVFNRAIAAAQNQRSRSRTISTATAPAPWSIHSATHGPSRLMSRMSHPKRSLAEWVR